MANIKEKDIQDFERYANKINEVIKRILKYNTNVNVYLAMEDLCLLNGESHDEYGNKQPENVVTSVAITNASGGDW